ncbi:hypothetical protein Peur_072759 [Populus x canadensis]
MLLGKLLKTEVTGLFSHSSPVAWPSNSEFLTLPLCALILGSGIQFLGEKGFKVKFFDDIDTGFLLSFHFNF